MQAENDRLRRDNERFVRLIDSGEWGRGRVAELTQAGECTMQPCVLESPCILVCQPKLCTEWMDGFCPSCVSMEALYTMVLMLLIQEPMPSRVKALALARVYMYTGNHQGTPMTLGRS